jgi:hypothetical protein
VNKRINGGITVTIKSTASGASAVTLDTLTGYDPSWDNEAESFEAWDFSIVEISKGRRFSLSLSTGVLDTSDLDRIKTALITRAVTLTCPEYPNGILMSVQSIDQTQVQANYNGKYYRLSFALKALSLESGNFNSEADT